MLLHHDYKLFLGYFGALHYKVTTTRRISAKPNNSCKTYIAEVFASLSGWAHGAPTTQHGLSYMEGKLSDLAHNTKSVKYEAEKCFVRHLLSNMLETTKSLICDATFHSEVSCVWTRFSHWLHVSTGRASRILCSFDLIKALGLCYSF